MAVTKSFPTGDAGGLSITDTRRVLAGLVARNADGTPRAGVLSAASAQIVTGRASMGYDVGVFTAATSRVTGGVELVANDALVTVPTTAAPAANSRLDVIWVRSRFTQHTDGSNLPEIGVSQGTAAAVPTKPTLPAGALELATAEILSTTTTTSAVVITQSAPFTTAAGGVVPARNLAELTAWAAPDGALARNLQTGALHQRVAGAWRVMRWDVGVPIMPASVVGGAINTDGTVSFTGAAAVSLNGVFDSSFREYEIVVRIDSRSVSPSFEAIRLRASGTDAAANYLWRRGGTTGGGWAESGVASGTEFSLALGGQGRSTKRVKVRNPAVSGPTDFYDGTGLEITGATVTSLVTASGAHTATLTADGFTLISPAGAFTGTVYVTGIA